MHAFLSNLANRETDRQTNEHGQKHVPPPLSEVNITFSFTNDCAKITQVKGERQDYEVTYLIPSKRTIVVNGQEQPQGFQAFKLTL